MKAIILTAALVIFSNLVNGQTFENPKTLGKNERLEFMTWYTSGNDGARMITGYPNEINSYLNELLSYYDISDTEIKGNSRTWRYITKYGTALELTAIISDRSGTIIMKEK